MVIWVDNCASLCIHSVCSLHKPKHTQNPSYYYATGWVRCQMIARYNDEEQKHPLAVIRLPDMHSKHHTISIKQVGLWLVPLILTRWLYVTDKITFNIKICKWCKSFCIPNCLYATMLEYMCFCILRSVCSWRIAVSLTRENHNVYCTLVICTTHHTIDIAVEFFAIPIWRQYYCFEWCSIDKTTPSFMLYLCDRSK